MRMSNWNWKRKMTMALGAAEWLGLAAVVFGIYQVNEPAAYIVGGLFVTAGAALATITGRNRRDNS